jgi:glycosyltransferase 2 family protein
MRSPPAASRALRIVRLAVSAALMALLLAVADIGRVAAVLASADPFMLLAAAGLFFLGILLFAYRWRLVLATLNADPPSVRFLSGAFLIGLFFNFFLPSTVGGDVARAELVRSRVRGRTEAYTSVLFDRFMAFNATLAISLAAAVVAWLRLGWFDPHVAVAWLVFAAGSAGFLVLVIRRPTLGKPVLNGGGLFHSLRLRLAQVRGVLRGYMTDLRLVGPVFLLAVAVQLVALILVVWLLGKALEIRVPLLFHLIAVPIIELIALVPVSFNGIGLRESAYVLLYAQAGVAPEAALALSLAWTLLLFGFSLIGSLCWLWPGLYAERRRPFS